MTDENESNDMDFSPSDCAKTDSFGWFLGTLKWCKKNLPESVWGRLCTVLPRVVGSVGDLAISAANVGKTSLDCYSDEIKARSVAATELTQVKAKAKQAAIASMTQNITEGMGVSKEHSQRVFKRFVDDILLKQDNLDAVSQIALQELSFKDTTYSSHSDTDNNSNKEVSPDWTNTLVSEAEKASSEEMRLLFGRILAGEIKNPGTFSRKTVRILNDLDQETAFIFTRFSSHCVIVKDQTGRIYDARLINFLNDVNGSVQAAGLTPDNAMMLEEFGLIVGLPTTAMNYNNISKTPDDLVFLGAKGPVKIKASKDAPILGNELTQSGRELLSICDLAYDKKFFDKVASFLKNNSINLLNMDDSEFMDNA